MHERTRPTNELERALRETFKIRNRTVFYNFIQPKFFKRVSTTRVATEN